MTELLTIFYNGHFTEMCYPEEVDSRIAKWGLPTNSIEVVQYPAGSVVAPFNIGTEKELYILKEEVPPPEDILTPYDFKVALKEILTTPAGKEFATLIRTINQKLLDAGLDVVVVEPTAEEIKGPEFYSITSTIQPVGV